MNRKAVVILGAAMIFIVASGAYFWQQNLGSIDSNLTILGKQVTAEQISNGRETYAANCASCHGDNLEGQPDWQRRLENGRMPAPPHDESGHTWHHSDQVLFTITKFGVGAVVADYESDMPAFADNLSDEETVAVLAFIKSTWPERPREAQAKITANDKDKL